MAGSDCPLDIALGTERELDLNDQPMTIYPDRQQRRVKVWVRFGSEAIRVDAKLVRTTPLAAGIEFRGENPTFQCWGYGNAVTVIDGG